MNARRNATPQQVLGGSRILKKITMWSIPNFRISKLGSSTIQTVLWMIPSVHRVTVSWQGYISRALYSWNLTIPSLTDKHLLRNLCLLLLSLLLLLNPFILGSHIGGSLWRGDGTASLNTSNLNWWDAAFICASANNLCWRICHHQPPALVISKATWIFQSLMGLSMTATILTRRWQGKGVERHCKDVQATNQCLRSAPLQKLCNSFGNLQHWLRMTQDKGDSNLENTDDWSSPTLSLPVGLLSFRWSSSLFNQPCFFQESGFMSFLFVKVSNPWHHVASLPQSFAWYLHTSADRTISQGDEDFDFSLPKVWRWYFIGLISQAAADLVCSKIEDTLKC